MKFTEEQLEGKWWHRLARVLILGITIGVFLRLLLGGLYDVKMGEEWFALFVILLSLFFSLITYFTLWLVYKKIILYIIFGKRNK